MLATRSHLSSPTRRTRRATLPSGFAVAYRPLPAVVNAVAALASDAPSAFGEWQSAIFIDDAPKLRSAVAAAERTGAFYVEFRVRHSDRSLHWIAGPRMR